MKTVNVDLLTLDKSISSLNECAKNVYSLHTNYVDRVVTILTDLKGSEKEEAINNLNDMLESVRLLGELIEKTSLVLTSARQEYLNKDEAISNQF